MSSSSKDLKVDQDAVTKTLGDKLRGGTEIAKNAGGTFMKLAQLHDGEKGVDIVSAHPNTPKVAKEHNKIAEVKEAVDSKLRGVVSKPETPTVTSSIASPRPGRSVKGG